MDSVRQRALAGRRVLVTGGMGFIGSNLAHRLVDMEAEVTIVDSLIPEYGGNVFNLDGLHDTVHINVSDMRDPYCIAYLVQNQEYIFNLAGQVSHLDSVTDPVTDLEINCKAQVTLLEACRKATRRPKIVYASTRQIYGRPQYRPVDEQHPIHPVDPNGINKSAGENYHLLYSAIHGIPACSLRLTNTFGPRMRVCDARQTFIGWWFRQLIEGKEILVYGDGTQERDLNFVGDVVDALILAAIHPETNGETYNLGAETISLKELAALLIRINGHGSYRLVAFPEERKSIDIGSFAANYSKITSQLGWVPVTPLPDGLRSTIEYYRQYKEHYW